MFRNVKVLGVLLITAFIFAIIMPVGARAEEAAIEGMVTLGENGQITLMADDGDYKVTGVDLSAQVGKWVTVSGEIVEEESGPVIKARDFVLNEETPAPQEEESEKPKDEG